MKYNFASVPALQGRFTINSALAIEDDAEPVVVFTSSNYMEAEFVASVLNGSDIEAFVVDDNVSRLCPWATLLVGGAKVLVSAGDVERSRDVLASVDVGESPIAGQCLSLPISDLAALLTLLRNWFTKLQR